jgi:sulfate-transporting ATPase
VAVPRRHVDAPSYEGNYDSCIEDLKRRKGPDADQPHRIAYKKLVRA